METLNHTLFLWLNAPARPAPAMLALGLFFAVYAVWIVPAAAAFGWLRGRQAVRQALLQAAAAAVAAWLVNQLIGWQWPQPRPFAIGLGHTLVPHAANFSFPSNHLAVTWAVAFSLLMARGGRRLGLALALLGVPIAWARIYVGVHFPLDMLGAALVALACAALARAAARCYLPVAYRAAMRVHGATAGRLREEGHE